MTKELKQTKANLDAANKEARQLMSEVKRLENENAHLCSDKQMLMWQMDVIRAALSRTVKP